MQRDQTFDGSNFSDVTICFFFGLPLVYWECALGFELFARQNNFTLEYCNDILHD